MLARGTHSEDGRGTVRDPQETSLLATTALAPGTWLLDPARTAVSFSGKAGRLGPTFRAAFTSVTGHVSIGHTTELAVDIDVRSISTGNRAWDDLLHSIDPFDATRCPQALYRGSADLEVGNRVGVAGALELRGVLQPLRLVAQVRARATDEVEVTATGEVDRRLFGVRCDLPGVGRFVPSVLRLDISVTAVRRD